MCLSIVSRISKSIAARKTGLGIKPLLKASESAELKKGVPTKRL